MKRTIKEVYDLIVEKRDNAERNTNIVINEKEKMLLAGQRQAYQDVLSLIESSRLLEEDKSLKALEIIKKKEIDVGLFISGYGLMNYNDENTLEYYNDNIIGKTLTQDEYDLLKEVLLCMN